MKQVRFEFEELPYETLSQFGLTREMIEDLPMHILEELSNGRHSPVLPILSLIHISEPTRPY